MKTIMNIKGENGVLTLTEVRGGYCPTIAATYWKGVGFHISRPVVVEESENEGDIKTGTNRVWAEDPQSI